MIYNEIFMEKAIALAEEGYREGDVPVGAVVVRDDIIIGEGRNYKRTTINPTDHAEIIAMNMAAKNIGDWRLNGCQIYSTLEPCIMCAGAILHFRIDSLYFGAVEPKFGGVVSKARILDIETLNHKTAYEYGFFQERISTLMKTFFREIRGKAKS